LRFALTCRIQRIEPQLTFEQCVQSEQDVREQLKRAWPNSSAADKHHCVALATTGGESSSTELITCVEMGRDVRASRSAANAQPGARRTQEAPSASTPTLGPATPGKASQANPAKDASVAEAAHLTRELQLAKADAQTANSRRRRPSVNSLMRKHGSESLTIRADNVKRRSSRNR
jgi:hypothetical protein